VRVTGYLDEPTFFAYIAASDALCNLRYPTVGESSGTLARALAMGLPAIVNNFGPFSEFPDDVVLKVPLELGQPTALAAALDSLMNNPGLRADLGKRAHTYMRKHCGVEQSALHYSAFADRVHQPKVKSTLSVVEALQGQA
jgi:glycosyltransferase involved in cell wall biosynthesis